MQSSARQKQSDHNLIERQCPQCSSDARNEVKRYSRDHWLVVECFECGFVYLWNVPDYSQLVDEFAWEKSYEAEHRRRVQERGFSKRVAKAFRDMLVQPSRNEKIYRRLFRPGPVLDVGCGAGTSVPSGYTPFGIELSRHLWQVANARMQQAGGRCVHAPAVEGIDMFEPKMFSGVILRSILEHERQPLRLLAKVSRVLRDDGAVFVRVPNFASLNRRIRGSSWCGFRYPDHVNYFTPRSLSDMAAKCGFRMKLLHPFRVAVDDNVNGSLRKDIPPR